MKQRPGQLGTKAAARVRRVRRTGDQLKPLWRAELGDDENSNDRWTMDFSSASEAAACKWLNKYAGEHGFHIWSNPEQISEVEAFVVH